MSNSVALQERLLWVI